MTTITLTTGYKGRIWCKIDESGDSDVVVEVVVSETKPEDGDTYWWKPVNDLELGGIFNGRSEVTLTIDDNCRVKEVK